MIRELAARCAAWVQGVYGQASLHNQDNRAARFVEEAIELAQAQGLGKDVIAKILERAYSRPAGRIGQEVAGSFFTLLVYCYVAKIDLWLETLEEVERVEELDPEVFRAKHREKWAAGTDLVPPL